MNITPTFNAAAGGPSGEAGTVTTGPSPHNPNGPNSSSSGVYQAEPHSREAAANNTHSPTSVHFASAVETNASMAVEDHVPRNDPGVTTVESARIELDMLERGRAKPKAQLNREPPQPLKKIMESKTERQREARVSGLKAYLEFKEREPEVTNSQDAVEDLEPRW